MSTKHDTLSNPHIRGFRWRHVKTGGLYSLVATGFIEATLTPAVIYEGDADGTIWVRPMAEFLDGRFVCIDGETTKEPFEP